MNGALDVGAYCIVIVGFLPRDARSAQRIAVRRLCLSVCPRTPPSVIWRIKVVTGPWSPSCN